MERRDAVKQERAVMYTHAHKYEPYIFVTGPHINIYFEVSHAGPYLVVTAPTSILCHKLPPRNIIVTCPSCTVHLTDPERSRTPTAELHPSGMMPRHTIGHPRYKTPDLRRPGSITAVSQIVTATKIKNVPVRKGQNDFDNENDNDKDNDNYRYRTENPKSR